MPSPSSSSSSSSSIGIGNNSDSNTNTNKRKRTTRTAAADPDAAAMNAALHPTSGEEADAELSYDSPTPAVGAAAAAAAAGGGGGTTAGGESHHRVPHHHPPHHHPHPAKRARRLSTSDGKRDDESEHGDRGGSPSSCNGGAAANGGQDVLSPAQLAALCPAGYSMNPPPTDRPVRVYADGVFDLFHLGHMRQLEQAKKAFPNTYLLVGLPCDAETHRRKGLTVLTDKERAESLRHCKWVDEVVEDAPWIVTPAFLDRHAIDYVAHDDEPYVSAESDDIYKPCKQAGKFMVTQRTEGISTTYIITKIVRDYEKYISRQLSRGASRQELNLSWLKKNEMDIKRHVAELRETIKNNWSTTGRELRDEFKNYWAPSPRPSSPYQFGTSSASKDTLGPSTAPATPTAATAAGAAGAAGPPGAAENGRPQPNWSHLEPPSRPQSPQTEFANGFSLGLIGGVRSWMQNRASRSGSTVASEDNSSDDDELPAKTGPLTKTSSPAMTSPPPSLSAA